MSPLHSKAEIISAIIDSGKRAQEWFQGISAGEFFHREGEVWSVSDNVDHLIKSINPVAKALKLPKAAMQAMFSKPEKASRTYEEVCAVYQETLARGGVASGSYLPNQETPEHPEEEKMESLKNLSASIGKLVSIVEKWDDSALDEAQLPHPLLGKLTVREMLFFTIYHILRHASQEGD